MIKKDNFTKGIVVRVRKESVRKVKSGKVKL